jgi:hypothetical protein
MGSENAHRDAQNAENGYGFCRLFRPIPQRWQLISQSQVTGDETWVSVVNVETKEQSKQWMHAYSPKKSIKV